MFCFVVFCSEAENTKPFRRRQKICGIMTLAFGKNVLDKADEQEDEWDKRVKAMVIGVQCLVT